MGAVQKIDLTQKVWCTTLPQDRQRPLRWSIVSDQAQELAELQGPAPSDDGIRGGYAEAATVLVGDFESAGRHR
jgi:hypothetical protein